MQNADIVKKHLKEMVKNYNILKKHIVLLPFMYIYRLVYKSIKKSDVAKKEIKEL